MKNNYKIIFGKLFFIISALALATLLCLRAKGLEIFISLVMAGLVAGYLGFFTDFISKSLAKLNILSGAVTCLMSVLIVFNFAQYFYSSKSAIYQLLTDFITLPATMPLNDAKLIALTLAVLSLWAIFIYLNYFIIIVGSVLKNIFASFNKV